MEEKFMLEAIKEAKKAEALLETPVGAVVVCDGVIVGRGCNTRETDKNALCHAEIKAIDEACRTLGGWRLHKCDIYVTLEPCIMCSGLMHQARIDRCVYGASDPKAGALGSLYSINNDERLNHNFEVAAGVLQEECANELRSFFKKKRKRNG